MSDYKQKYLKYKKKYLDLKEQSGGLAGFSTLPTILNYNFECLMKKPPNIKDEKKVEVSIKIESKKHVNSNNEIEFCDTNFKITISENGKEILKNVNVKYPFITENIGQEFTSYNFHLGGTKLIEIKPVRGTEIIGTVKDNYFDEKLIENIKNDVTFSEIYEKLKEFGVFKEVPFFYFNRFKK